jgi:hypothetical protein
MPSRIPDLWPDDISTEVLTPLAILRAQVPGLERRTKGLLEVDLNSVEKEKEVVHNFDLVAPALDRFRERILVVTHERNRVYPATLEAAVFLRKSRPENFLGSSLAERAMSQDDFIRLMKEVIRSPEVRSSIESLIARSNELSVQGPSEQGGAEAGVAPVPPPTSE